MAVGKFSKRITSFLSGNTLKMFRFDCLDSGMGESQKIRQIILTHYRNKPPAGFENSKPKTNYDNIP